MQIESIPESTLDSIALRMVSQFSLDGSPLGPDGRSVKRGRGYPAPSETLRLGRIMCVTFIMRTIVQVPLRISTF